jgi:hypothetical protein
MTEHIEVEKPCVRGCTRDDGNPMAATHGEYCGRCWGRLKAALSITGELAHHLIGNAIASGGGSDDRVDASRDAPVPFNQAAFDDANELYSLLAYWAAAWATTLRTKVPDMAVGAWRADNGKIMGLPAGVSAETASSLVGTLAAWIRDRLDTILASGAHDDIDALDDAVRDVWRMNARWPRLERPVYSPIPCQRDECAKPIAVFPPRFRGDERTAICDAGHVYQESEFEFLKIMLAEESKVQARANKTAARLAKKYGLSRNR